MLNKNQPHTVRHVLRFILHQNQHICLSLRLKNLPDATFLSHFQREIYFWSHFPAGMQDLSPWPGIKATPPALEVWGLNHWTTKEVPKGKFFKMLLQAPLPETSSTAWEGPGQAPFLLGTVKVDNQDCQTVSWPPDPSGLSPHPGTSSPVSLLLSPHPQAFKPAITFLKPPPPTATGHPFPLSPYSQVFFCSLYIQFLLQSL